MIISHKSLVKNVKISKEKEDKGKKENIKEKKLKREKGKILKSLFT